MSRASTVGLFASLILANAACGDSGTSAGGGGASAGGTTSASSASGSQATGATSGTTGSSATGTSGPTTSASTGGGSVVPPLGGSSGGSGGPSPVAGMVEQANGITYRLIVPASLASPSPLLLVYSGTEGGAQMTSNLQQVGQLTGTSGFIEAILDGVDYNGDGNAGATVLDDVRAKYDIDNDRTYLLGESAGTSAAEELGFHLRESFFAAYWANDVNAVDGPAETAAEVGFAPWGQVGPGGQFTTADAIVANMQAAGYQLPNPAPYAGQGAGTHGDPNQFVAAVSWFPGKSRN